MKVGMGKDQKERNPMEIGAKCQLNCNKWKISKKNRNLSSNV